MFMIKKKIIFFGCLIFLLMFLLRNVHMLCVPVVHMDEIGYWANAAFMNGQNWSSIMENFSPYYSYGYSIILFLLMKLFRNPIMLYRAAVVINILMVICGYCILNYIVKRIFSHVDNNIRNLICLIPLFYPSIQEHTQIAWAESYLFLLFLLSIILIMKVYESGRAIFYFVYALILIDMYITHQRSIAIFTIGIFSLIFISIFKRDRWKQFILFAMTIILCLMGSRFVKNSIYNNVYTTVVAEKDYSNDEKLYDGSKNKEIDNTSVKVDVNDYSGQAVKIKYMFTPEGFDNLLVSFFGKLYYFVLASFFLGGMGIWYLAQQIMSFIKEKNFNNLYTLVYCYILGSFFGTMVVAAVFMIYPGRIDTVAYGRYTDWLGTMIIIFGVFKLISSNVKENIRMLLYQIIFCLLFLNIFEKYIDKFQVSGLNIECSQMLLYFSQLDEKNILKVMTLTVTVVGIVLCILTLIKKKYLRSIVIAPLLIGLWIRINEPVIEHLLDLQNTNMNAVYPIVEFIEEAQTQNVYYLYDDTVINYVNACTGGIQYFLQDISVHCIDDIMMVKEDDAIIVMDRNLVIPCGYTAGCETIFYKAITVDGR